SRAGSSIPSKSTWRRSTPAGGGGALGAALLEALLATAAFQPLHVLVTQDFHATPAGLRPVLAGTALALPAGLGTLGVVVFDRERHANGRDAAFLRPQPDQLLPLATALQRAGVRDLLVVLPHDAARLPQALRAGLANLDEQAVAALGFERVVFMRSAQPPAGATSRGLQRLADLVLAQLRLMTPQPWQPVRARKVAQLAAALARLLPDAPAGTRVLAPELVWQAAQGEDTLAFAGAWLRGEALPDAALKVPRL
ncbi:MAG: hypothetical protein KF788_15085, partial [Piscinibacter sp.]|nr:hypothetical protein [Piscinibacter sp.]